jgi:hypothetical protein
VTAYSKQLLAQSSLDVHNIVKTISCGFSHSRSDSATLNGTATNGQPTGILTVTANSEGSYDYNKRSPDVTFSSTYDKVMEFYKNVESAISTSKVNSARCLNCAGASHIP